MLLINFRRSRPQTLPPSMLCCRCHQAAAYAAIGLCLFVAASGCRQPDEIREYRVLKESIVDSKGQDRLAKVHRMLVAMFPLGEEAWFFKFAGPTDKIANHTNEFRDFVDSVRFENDGAATPVWSRPENWNERRGGGEMRFATLVIPGEIDDLELSVIRLPIKEPDPQQYLLENVNRWRGQMRLPPVDQQGLPNAIEELTVAGQKAVLVDLIGNMQSAPPMRAPFMERRMAERMRPAAGARKTGHDPDVLDCQPPPTWEPAPLGPMDSALFQVADDGKEIEISVRQAGGDLLANVNRWAVQQLQLDPVSAEQLAKLLEPTAVDGHAGHYIELGGGELGGGELGGGDSGSNKAIVGIIVKIEDAQWFVKLMGDAQLAERERDNFRDFAKSLRFK